MSDKNDLVGVLLAGGKGLRSYPSTKFIPKPLFKVDSETLLLKNILKTVFFVFGFWVQSSFFQPKPY